MSDCANIAHPQSKIPLTASTCIDSGEVIRSNSDFLSLSDYLLNGILFSGYLSTYEVLNSIRLVSRQCNSLTLKYLGVIDLSIHTNRRRIHLNLVHKRHLADMLSRSAMLQFVDLSYAYSSKNADDAVPFPKLSDLIHERNNKNIRYLSLRGTTATDESLQNVSRYSSLMYLDISKYTSSSLTAIGDTTISSLANMSNLHWLNLSGTSVSNEGIRALCEGSSKHSLKYLAVQQCVWLSGDVCRWLRGLSLVLLDLSGVSSLTDESITDLADAKFPLYNSLTTIIVNFCPALTSTALTALQLCPKLSYIECRRSDRSVVQYNKDYLQHASSLLQRSVPLAIISEHEDQIHTLRKFGTELRDIYNFSSSSLFGTSARRRKLCDMICFPYDSLVEVIRKNAAECETDLVMRSKSQSLPTFGGTDDDDSQEPTDKSGDVSREDSLLPDVQGLASTLFSNGACSSSSTGGVNLELLLPKDSFKLHVSPEHL